MKSTRSSRSLSTTIISTAPPFSNFEFLENDHFYQSVASLKRVFALARNGGCKSLLIEDIVPTAALKSEIDCLNRLGYQNELLQRISFWDIELSSVEDLVKCSSQNLKGYLIFKYDSKDGVGIGHIFESIFNTSHHANNFIPGLPCFEVSVVDKTFSVSGVMYCQQNGVNKACAHVALRSLLSGIVSKDDLSYEDLHSYSGSVGNPKNGLSSNQIRSVLNHYKINYFDLDYLNSGISVEDYPYNKWLYAGIENCHGALLGFELDGPRSQGQRHIIPFWGHTFNQDSWAPRAGNAYFRIGSSTHYFPSEEWLSSFIGHDDNFGPNFCVPRHYLKPEQIKYVVALAPEGVKYDAIIAEAVAIDSLYSTLQNLPGGNDCFWFQKLRNATVSKDIVLRTVFVTKDTYIQHLSELKDWKGKQEQSDITTVFEKLLPEQLWMVEVSIPELFATNYRKLGEIILDAGVKVKTDSVDKQKIFIMTRFPQNYYVNSGDNKSFIRLESNLNSHCALFVQ